MHDTAYCVIDKTKKQKKYVKRNDYESVAPNENLNK